MGDKRKPGERSPGGAERHHRGVTWSERYQKWKAYAGREHLGWFRCHSCAVRARLRWERENHVPPPAPAPIKPYKKRPPMPHHRGVSWCERKEKWFVYTSKVDGKQKFLGYRELFNDAVQLRLDWETANARGV